MSYEDEVVLSPLFLREHNVNLSEGSGPSIGACEAREHRRESP